MYIYIYVYTFDFLRKHRKGGELFSEVWNPPFGPMNLGDTGVSQILNFLLDLEWSSERLLAQSWYNNEKLESFSKKTTRENV